MANSRHVAARIRKYYRREAHVIHPPVEADRFSRIERAEDGYYLFLGRLVAYKRADLAAQACTLLDRPLKVVGGGRAAEELKTRSGSSVEWLGELDDAELPG